MVLHSDLHNVIASLVEFISGSSNESFKIANAIYM